METPCSRRLYTALKCKEYQQRTNKCQSTTLRPTPGSLNQLIQSRNFPLEFHPNGIIKESTIHLMCAVTFKINIVVIHLLGYVVKVQPSYIVVPKWIQGLKLGEQHFIPKVSQVTSYRGGTAGSRPSSPVELVVTKEQAGVVAQVCLGKM